MKRPLSLSVCLLIALLSFAHDFEKDGIYYNIISSLEPYEVAVITHKNRENHKNKANIEKKDTKLLFRDK